ncbi:hypothetical protein AN9409.2 [Aspergillus nidulans FGSC A4]|uniref:DNA-binding protein HGH1, putative (AFU_orthologue AFUA_3G04260) n=1 Tax=Emericella nidulans (strain FGSC A4 / ATCC 38163 / CBS 112.46 / NRRL 194 / M139) TaxID=227321 RepID=Q5AQM1_EMENI|nr:hypothetical protein [Aspergillus nidulans FGSC A4]EAA65146.1 hypothetical protein AN9409.2 [Aspergillus nidulans FGSC A4]CBF87556.1 TPA: DNA-binding protein HGH1, putative (AFU_orthologue; AFUA_3G04260) [Aspergillus nidulans FGSC A4]|eukprot:XP_682678.1 hypothetical protein AN9409.2 [Aspergillus nidulans FGSC A4]
METLRSDRLPIASDALTILVNLSGDKEILDKLATDDAFMETLLNKVTNNKEGNADGICMLFANLGKSENIKELLTLKRRTANPVSNSEYAIDQLMDCFVKGADGALNQHANYDYLSYLFADLSKLEEGRKYFTTRQDYDGVVPVTKLTVFTEHESTVRRRGVASTIKNVAFEIPFHPTLFSEDEANLLPYILLPIMGPEEYSEEDTANMLPDLQLLPPDKKRESDNGIIVTHLETLLLLTTTREGRDKLRAVNVYPVIRECHLRVDDDGVREACDRWVQVIMRDEEDEGNSSAGQNQDDDRKVVELF